MVFSFTSDIHHSAVHTIPEKRPVFSLLSVLLSLEVDHSWTGLNQVESCKSPVTASEKGHAVISAQKKKKKKLS